MSGLLPPIQLVLLLKMMGEGEATLGSLSPPHATKLLALCVLGWHPARIMHVENPVLVIVGNQSNRK